MEFIRPVRGKVREHALVEFYQSVLATRGVRSEGLSVRPIRNARPRRRRWPHDRRRIATTALRSVASRRPRRILRPPGACSRFAQCGHPMPTTRRWPTSATEPNRERLGFGGAGGSTEPSNSGMIVEFRSVTAASMAQPQYSNASSSRLAIASAKASDRNASRRCDDVSLAVPATHSAKSATSMHASSEPARKPTIYQ